MGRSAYLCPCSDCLQFAQKKDRLGRSLKAPVSKEVYQILWQRLPATNEAGVHAAKAETVGDGDSLNKIN